ncbi:Electron transfer flavoprotein domain-containing protein [Lentibacillus halodurans]|uniref:Electron transfer flavoprotein domain-containing protein n=1 Tax=Lentibacillus halodurans TaxID=237679 RepID=A0A1I0ZAV1_9BACI|nr:Electron transfer flavoprotein domain-containing protein [Lentibacillus halodurans]
MSKLLVFAESREGTLRNVSFEAVAAAKKIDADAEVVVGVIFGAGNFKEQGDEIIRYGADRAITVQHENLENYTSEAYGQAAMADIQEESPDGIVMGHTSIGKDLTPKLAPKLDSGLISDAADINYDGDNVTFIRPIYSGKAFEKKVITEGLTFVTIRPNNIKPLDRDESRSGEVAA